MHIVDKARNERIGRLLRMHANKREDIQEIFAGDISAAWVSNGFDRRHHLRRRPPIILESIEFPTPVIQLAVEPKTKADQEKMGIAMEQTGAGRPYLPRGDGSGHRARPSSGMGELHLEILVDRMMREFNVGANVGKPQVAYRETIRKQSQAEKGKYIRQTGGSGQYGHVRIRLEPNEPGKGYEAQERPGSACGW